MTDTAWTQLTGLYSFADNPVPSLLLYAESSSATASYYPSTTSSSPRSPTRLARRPTTGLSSISSLGRRLVRHGGAIATSSESAHGGSQSLKSNSRTASWNGPAYDVTNVMFNGSTYRCRLGSSWRKRWVQHRAIAHELATRCRQHHQLPHGGEQHHGGVDHLGAPAATYPVALANTKLTLYVGSMPARPTSWSTTSRSPTCRRRASRRASRQLHRVRLTCFPIGGIGYTGGITGVQGELTG